MNTIHNNGGNDQTLNEGLEELGQAYSALEQDQPPELLDQAILNSAHRALEEKPGWKQFGWMHGLATAAVFVLTFTIILDQRELAPEFREEILLDAPSRMEGTQELKKQSADNVGKSTMATEPATKFRRKTMAADAPAPATASMEVSSEQLNEISEQESLNNLPVQSAGAEKNEYTDKDDVSLDFLPEEVMMDEADVLTESPPVDAVSRQMAPATVAEPASSAVKARHRMDSTIEQELHAIIELKNAGDETWLTQLEAFAERYPDYPIPEELKP
jgi:hypothetical protein